jgi:hypothetical protein
LDAGDEPALALARLGDDGAARHGVFLLMAARDAPRDIDEPASKDPIPSSDGRASSSRDTDGQALDAEP